MAKQTYQLDLKEGLDMHGPAEMVTAVQILTALQPALHTTYRGSDIMLKDTSPQLTVYSDEEPVPELPEHIRKALTSFWDIKKVD